MKHNIYLLLLAITIGLSQCCKEKPTSSNDSDIPGLPPATQIGANTFGCLVNGVAWVPEGYGGGSPNLSIDYDPTFKNGIFNIVAKKITAQENTQIIIGIKDSLNYVVNTKSYNLTRDGLFGSYYFKDCRIFSADSTTNIIFGSMTIIKLDRQKRIIAGSFDFSFTNNFCDTITITKGRFDFKF